MSGSPVRLDALSLLTAADNYIEHLSLSFNRHKIFAKKKVNFLLVPGNRETVHGITMIVEPCLHIMLFFKPTVPCSKPNAIITELYAL